MPDPKRAPVPDVVPFPQQACLNCSTSRTFAARIILALSLDNARLRTELEKAHAALRRESHQYGGDPHARRGRL